MNPDQIKARLEYLIAYELSIMQTDEVSEAKERELDRIVATKSQLQSMLKERKRHMTETRGCVGEEERS